MNFDRFDDMSRTQVIAWARKALSLPNLAILDTETTGQRIGSGGQDEVIEICLIDRDGAPLINTLVHPTGAIHPDAARISGITDDMVVASPRFDDLSQALSNLLNGRAIVIYNADYDAHLLQAAFQQCGMELPPCDIRCAMRAYATYRQMPGRRPGQYVWHKLTNACAYEHIAPSHQAHRALRDCLATLELLRHMANAVPR